MIYTIILVIILLIIILKFNYQKSHFINYYKCDKRGLGKITSKIFNKHKIYYTIGYGTLLGAVRHWDVIDWDDDADLHIYNKDIPKIMKLKEEFAEYGLILEKNWILSS